MSSQQSNIGESSNLVFDDGFSTAQKQKLIATIAVAIVEVFRNQRNQDDSDDSVSFHENGDDFANSENDDQTRRDNENDDSQNWKLDDIEYFDSEYEGSANTSSSIVNVDKHVFYRDVYAFVDRLKNMASLRDEQKLRTMISQCLREFVLIWHFMKLSELEKMNLRDANLDLWYGALIQRFKERTLVALSRLQRERYTISNARQQKNPRLFAQNIFRYAKIAKMNFIYNQISIVWNNLNVEFRRDISKPNAHITIRSFLDQLNSKFSIWFEMARRTADNFSNQRNQLNFSNSNKHERRQARSNDFSQSSTENSVPQQY